MKSVGHRTANTHVIASSGGRWAVRRSGAPRATRVFESRGDAVDFARTLARAQHVRLFIHDRDGTVQHMDSYEADANAART